MEIFSHPEEYSRGCAALREQGSLGFVPTMGALHAGHVALVRAAKARDRFCAVSIFVNPTQFGPNEDLARYPRQLEGDCELLRSEGVDLVLAPEAAAVYPNGFATFVEVEGLGGRLCGASRPGHFRGVATVVLKLLLWTLPSRAYFGQKDAAQLAVIRRMVRDLNVPVEIVACPIVRDADGLALSSRNAYLKAEERRAALAIPASLREIEDAVRSGERRLGMLLGNARARIAETPGLKLDYYEAVDPDTLLPRQELAAPALFAVAAFCGKTRLIDNWVFEG